MDLSIDASALEVAPGSSVATTVTVTNLGEEVERFRLEVHGPAGAFATAEPPDVRMLPGKQERAVIRFAPARDPQQPSGPHPFQVVARSTVNPDVAARQQGTVLVGAFAEVGAELLPPVTKGRRPGRHTLELANRGNEPTTVSLALQDKDKELEFSPSAFETRLAPGEKREELFTVVGPVPWFGRTQTFPFTAEGRAPGVPQPIRLEGTRRQRPRFPWWVPTLALALVGIAIAIYALRPAAEVPGVVGKDEALAVTELKEAGYKPAVSYKGDPDAETGTVISTDPQAATEYDKGETVRVLVSQGPCGGECPTLTPNVVGLDLPDAERLLADEGLTAKVNEQPNEAPAGQVLLSNPQAKEAVRPDNIVFLRVSAGPESSASPTSGGESPSPSSPSSPSDGNGGGDKKITMPDLSGEALGAARTALVGLGLGDAITERLRRTDDAEPGAIVSTDPPADSEIALGDRVTLVVAAEPIDLVALAAEATWMDQLAFLHDYQPDVDDVSQPGVGNEFSTTGDGTPVLVVEPDTGTSLIGTYTLPGAPIEGDRLLGAVRIGDPIVQTVSLTLGGEELAFELGEADDTGRQSLMAELPATDSTELLLTVSSTGEAADTEIRFVDLRIAAE